MHEAVSCDGICLDPCCPRITDQREPTGGGGEGECSAERCRPGLIGRALAFFRNETTGKQEMQFHPQRNVSNRLLALSPRRSLTPL